MRWRELIFLFVVVGVSSASAITLPNFPTAEPDDTATPVVDRDGAELLAVKPEECEPKPDEPAPCSMDNIRACVVSELGLNLDYRHSSQDFSTFIGDPSTTQGIDSSTELNSTALRLEYVAVEFVSIYLLGVRHDGTGKSANIGSFQPPDLDLDGWGWGAGITGFIPVLGTATVGPLTTTPFFVTDFNYTYNDFHDIKSGIDLFSATQRLALGVRGRKEGSRLSHWGLTLTGGASYLNQPGTQVLVDNDQTIKIRPDDTWIPLAGLVLSYFGKGKVTRPLVSLSIEGGWGDREEISLNLRYETHKR